MTWHDMMWHDIIWNEMIWYDMIYFPPLCLQLSRGWFWLQTSAKESFTRSRGTSSRTTLRRTTMVRELLTSDACRREEDEFIPSIEFIHLAKIISDIPEQDEKTRQSTEQWREFHYDGMYPPQEYNRQSVWETGREERCDAVSWKETKTEKKRLEPHSDACQHRPWQLHSKDITHRMECLKSFFNPCVADIGFMSSLFGLPLTSLLIVEKE